MRIIPSEDDIVALKVLPYGHHWVDEKDIQAVEKVLRSDWLTSGPMVQAFERSVANLVGVEEAVAVSSGTAALHAAMYAAGIGPGDKVILPPITFVATANSVVFQGGTPIFTDVDPDTLLIDPRRIEEKIDAHVKAIVAVDYAGQPCDYDLLRTIANRHKLVLIADSCHALGAEYKGRRVGTLADLTVFSFHPVKHITTGEGGMVITSNTEFAKKARMFRNHGIDMDYRSRAKQGTWYYEVVDLGYNYRITDIQCSLGLSQLRKLRKWIARRNQIAKEYDRAFTALPSIQPLSVAEGVLHAYHLYVIRLSRELTNKRAAIFADLWSKGIEVNVHYIPVHLHPFYRQRFGTKSGQCPIAEAAYQQILSLPIFPAMTQKDVHRVIRGVNQTVNLFKIARLD